MIIIVINGFQCKRVDYHHEQVCFVCSFMWILSIYLYSHIYTFWCSVAFRFITFSVLINSWFCLYAATENKTPYFWQIWPVSYRICHCSCKYWCVVFWNSSAQSFKAKGIAGNIVHPVAKTNAIVAGLIVIEAIKVLKKDVDKYSLLLWSFLSPYFISFRILSILFKSF